MFSVAARLDLGPIRCAWGPYRHGEPAQARVAPQLADWLNVDPAALDLARDARGRPRLGPRHPGYDVSWGHSGEGLLLALGAGVRVGADLEWRRPRPRALKLAARFFTAEETAHLAGLPDAAARETAFVRLWCAKEAVLKAHGHGLAFGLHRLAFAADGAHWRMVACDPELGAPADWTLHAFAPWPAYEATLAWRAPAPDAG